MTKWKIGDIINELMYNNCLFLCFNGMRSSIRNGMARIILGIAAVIIISSAGAYAVLGECQPYGDATYEGQPVADGLEVKAFIGEIIVAQSATIGRGYSLAIPADNPETVEKDGWVAGDVITIHINGRIATPSFQAFAGSERHNLEVNTLDIKLDTWGKIKALFR